MIVMRPLITFKAFAFILYLLLTACGGRVINKNIAQELIANLPPDNLPKDDVYIETVTQISSNEAIVETKLKTVFRFKKENDTWVVQEVRLGQGPWENINNISLALQEIKIAETRMILDRVVEAVEKYREENGSLPVFDNYVALSDLLSPAYLTPLIRLDAWRNPLAAEYLSPDSLRLSSMGPDGKFGTTDDIAFTKIFP